MMRINTNVLRALARAVNAFATYAAYQVATSRTIPVMLLEPVEN